MAMMALMEAVVERGVIPLSATTTRGNTRNPKPAPPPPWWPLNRPPLAALT